MSESAMPRAVVWLRASPARFDVAVAVFTAAVASPLFLATPERFDTGWPEVVAGVGAFALLLVRRHRPSVLLALALTWSAGHIAVLERPTPMLFATIVLLATVCVRIERWPAIGLGVLIGIVLYVLGLIGNDAELGDARAVIGIAWTAMAVGVADAIRSWRRYRESADAHLRATVAATDARVLQQVSDERLAIARELHDLLAHNLSVMNVQTGAALHLLRSDPDRAEESLVAARDAGRGVLDELRDLLTVLRHDDPNAEPPDASLPTVGELPALVETMRTSGLEVRWNRSGEVRSLPPAASLAAFRITQEALTNAAKHGAGSVDLTTDWTDERLSIRVTNRPRSNDPARSGSPGHGLIGMRERAAANGGELSARLDDDLFVVDARLPVATARHDEEGRSR